MSRAVKRRHERFIGLTKGRRAPSTPFPPPKDPDRSGCDGAAASAAATATRIALAFGASPL
jgi:hypothetical protein